MKRSLFLFALVFQSLLGVLHADWLCGPIPLPTAEVKFGYFWFNESVMRNVYNHGGADVQLCSSWAIPGLEILHLYGSVEYFRKYGHSLGGHQSTSIWAIPLSFGVQPFFRLGDWIQYYLTVGPRYFFVRANNNSSYVQRHMRANGCGGFANSGLLLDLGEYFGSCFFFDIFGEYSYKRLHFNSSHYGTEGHTVQVGGWTVGGGLGCFF